MVISGSSDNATEFLKKLNPSKLVDLTTDLLFLKGHSNLKVTDGPGDGCRDIHSITKTGEKHLTQCKYKSKPINSVSSKESGELPLGMIKFGYKKGLFVTNTKMSPQTKKEFIDNYPDLELDYIEGFDIVEEVFSNVILRAIWYDSETIDKVSHVIVVPVVARDLVRDRPILLISNNDLKKLDELLITLDIEGKNLQMKLSHSFISSSAFNPYRPPIIKTFSEPWSPQLRSVEALLMGISLLEDLESSVMNVGSYLLSELKKKVNKGNHHIALRLGRPYLTPLSGESVAAHIELPLAPQTLILQDGSEYKELEWILPSPNSGWYPPVDFRTLGSDWVRWYNPRLDTCLNLMIISPPDEVTKQNIEEQREFFIKWWNESLFAILPKSNIRLFEARLPTPTQTLDWCENKILCSWFHGNLAPGLRSKLEEPDEIDSLETFPWGIDVHEANKVFKELAERVDQLGGKIVQPKTARHMLATVEEDPFPSTDMVLYRSVDLIRDPEGIPSPIDPNSRKLEFTVCWRLCEDQQNKDFTLNIAEIVDEIINTKHPELIPYSYIDIETIREKYLIVQMSMKNKPDHESTDEVIQKMEYYLELAINDIEEMLKIHFSNLIRSTKEYWKMEIGILY